MVHYTLQRHKNKLCVSYNRLNFFFPNSYVEPLHFDSIVSQTLQYNFYILFLLLQLLTCVQASTLKVLDRINSGDGHWPFR